MEKNSKQKRKSEQINHKLEIIYDYDQPVKSSKEILEIYKNVFKKNCGIEKFEGHNIYYYDYNGKREYFVTASITGLGNPHPLYKKRLQLKEWYKKFYNQYKNEFNNIHFIGIYRYNENIIFVEFNIEDYINKKMNSSSAHVYSNDLYQALKYTFFSKKDRKNNTITTISEKNFKAYIENTLDENEISKLFEKYNNEFPFFKWIKAVEAIKEMKENDWYQWKGAEWAGWFLEYKINKFIKKEGCQNTLLYIGNDKKSDLDFDLFFTKNNFYGDLKASDIEQKEIIGNDKENVINVIKKYGKLWYVIYEHKTIKDIDKNNEMAIARMEILGTPYERADKISYMTRMKHSVKFEKMRIFEINEINMELLLEDFKQGKQPTGEKRNMKIKFKKSNIDNFLIYSYDGTKK